MKENSVVGVYTSLDAAESSIRLLGDGGFPIQKVSIVATQIQDSKRVHGFVTPCDIAKSSATTGAWMGGIFGLLVGAAFLWVPGFGPLVVMGSLSAMFLGGIEGAMAGAAVTGLLGWLAGVGISKEKIISYENDVKAGKYLVIAHGPSSSVEQARAILSGTKPEHLEVHNSVA